MAYDVSQLPGPDSILPRAASPFRHRPRLDIRTPVAAGIAVVLLIFGGGIGGAAVAPIDKGVGVPGQVIVETKTKPVQHQRGGTVARVHVVDGQKVESGDLLISLETKALDEQIGALTAQAEAAKRQLDLVRLEVSTIKDLFKRNLSSRSRVLALESQLAEVEKENAGLKAKILLTEQELERAAVRAPASGRVLQLAVPGPGTVIQPGATLLDIVPEADRLVVEGRLAPNQIENVKPGMPAKVWLTALSWRDQRPLEARLAWVSADSVEDKRTGAPYFVARVELEGAAVAAARALDLRPGMRAEILLLTGERTLLGQLVDPLLRNLHRAFRG